MQWPIVAVLLTHDNGLPIREVAFGSRTLHVRQPTACGQGAFGYGAPRWRLGAGGIGKRWEKQHGSRGMSHARLG